jgi:hypothetical protein
MASSGRQSLRYLAVTRGSFHKSDKYGWLKRIRAHCTQDTSQGFGMWAAFSRERFSPPPYATAVLLRFLSLKVPRCPIPAISDGVAPPCGQPPAWHRRGLPQ